MNMDPRSASLQERSVVTDAIWNQLETLSAVLWTCLRSYIYFDALIADSKMMGMFLMAWRYRHFILSSIRTEFRARFIRSRLGGLWMIIHPLAQAAIFALVLAGIMHAKLQGMTDSRFAYPLYLLSGMLAWSLFSEVISRCLTLFIDNGNLLKKIAFPHISLPLIVTGSALFNNLLLFLAIIVLFGLLGHVPGIQTAWV